MPIDPLHFFPRGKGNNKLDQLQVACVTYPLLLGGHYPKTHLGVLGPSHGATPWGYMP